MLRIEPLDPTDPESFEAFYRVYEAADRVEGRLPTLMTRDELRPKFGRVTGPSRRQGLLAYDGDEVVGVGDVDLPVADNLTLAHVGAYVRPDRRRRGVGTQLMRAVGARVHADGRTTWQSWVTGRSAVDPAGHRTPGEHFATAMGMTCRLLDAERVLDLPVDQEVLDRLAAEAAPAHREYELASWVGRCPARHRGAYAQLKAALMDMAPDGDLEHESERWDEARLDDFEAKIVEMGRTLHVVAALTFDGEVVGHNELTVPEHDPGRIYQWDTLVLPAHRGHRLGIAMKVANLVAVQRAHPERTLLRTWNAADNTAMIAVNDAMGFRLLGYTGEWQGPVRTDL